MGDNSTKRCCASNLCEQLDTSTVCGHLILAVWHYLRMVSPPFAVYKGKNGIGHNIVHQYMTWHGMTWRHMTTKTNIMQRYAKIYHIVYMFTKKIDLQRNPKIFQAIQADFDKLTLHVHHFTIVHQTLTLSDCAPCGCASASSASLIALAEMLGSDAASKMG